MGCCCSNEENSYEEQDSDETRPLVRDHTSININPSPVNAIGNGTPGGAVVTGPARNDNHSELVRILEDTARNLIDFGTLDTETVEYQEQKSRSAHYRERLSALGAVSQINLYSLPAGAPNPNTVLFSPSIPHAEIEQMRQLSLSMSQAVLSIRATGKDQLVVALSTFL